MLVLFLDLRMLIHHTNIKYLCRLAKDQYPKAIHLSLEKTVLQKQKNIPIKTTSLVTKLALSFFSAIYTFTYMILYKVK